MAHPSSLRIFAPLALLVLLPLHGAWSEPAFPTPRHILILNSYQKGYSWTDEQSESALSAFKSALPEATEDVVYMDWKRHPTQATLADLRQTLMHRYAEAKIDLVVTSDDAALSFALANRKAILWNAPVVFMGVFASSDLKLTGGQQGVTGVYEIVDLEGTIALASSILPKAKSVYVIHDKSETSLSMEADIDAILDKMGLPLERHVLGGLVFSELLAELGRVPPDSIVLLASYARDPNNLTMQPEEFARVMSSRCPAPLFVLYTHMMGTGAFGGSLLDGRLQGEVAADLGGRILSGAPAEFLPRIAKKTVYPCFDYRQLERFGIALDRLPKNSVILNKPFSFFETYKTLIVATSLVVAALASLIVVLLMNIGVRRRIEAELRSSRDETAALNADLERRVTERTRDLSESNERLAGALDELRASREREIEREKLAALGHLTADIAHELNTPLGAILAAERMADGAFDPLFSILSGSERLSAEEIACLHRLLSLAISSELETDPAKQRVRRKKLAASISAVGAPEGEFLAEKLAEIGCPEGEPALAAWCALPRFALVVETAYGIRSATQSRLIIKGAAEKAAAVVAALKLYAREEPGAELERVDLREELESVLLLFRGKVKHGVEISRQYAVVPPVLCYPDKLSQVWMNLIDNALYAMSYKGLLSLSIAPEGDRVVVSVGDSGKGIADSARDKVFQPFFTTKPRGEGSGLGLDICKRLLEEIGASIDFTSSPEGSVFRVSFAAAVETGKA